MDYCKCIHYYGLSRQSITSGAFLLGRGKARVDTHTHLTSLGFLAFVQLGIECL